MDGKGLTAFLGVIALIGVSFVYVQEDIVELPNPAVVLGQEPEREQVFEITESPEPADDDADDDEEAEPEEAPEESPEPSPEENEPAEPAIDPVDDYGVSTGHPLATQVGMEVLEAGGNAVDAAAAVSYALGVVDPGSSGIGGGGVMLVHELGSEPVAYNYRESAPLDGDYHFLGIGVPGFVAGIERVHADYGSLPLADLIRPAIRFAEEGVTVSPFLSERLDGAAYRLPLDRIPHFFPDGERAIRPGETIVQPELAENLRLIAEQGSDVFYRGEIAELIAAEVDGVGMEDLDDFEVVVTEPTTGVVGDYDVYTAPAPMTGMMLVQILQMAEAIGIQNVDDTADYINVLTEITREANRDRLDHLGDPRFIDLDLEQLTSVEYARHRAARIDPENPPPADEYERVDDDERAKSDTTHFVVVDRDGRMVSGTNTLSNFFGSGFYLDGFFLNDQLTNFGQDPASPNLPEPGKRPRSFITPTILSLDDRPVLGIGSAGGSRIPTIMGQLIINFALFGQRLEEAAEAPRFAVEGPKITIEDGIPGRVAGELESRGYRTERWELVHFFGGTQGLLVDYDAGRIEGHADHRREGSAETRQGAEQ